MKRRLLLALALLLAAIALALAGVVGTTAGARWVAARAVAALPGLSIDTVDGSLAGTLRLGGVRWDDGGTRVEVARVEARIRLPPLLAGRIELPLLAADDVVVTLRERADAASPPAASGVVDLPVITIDALRLAPARIESDAHSVAFEQIVTRFAMGGARIELAALDARGPDGRAEGALGLDLARPLPLADADLRFDLAVDSTPVRGRASMAPSGDGHRIDLALEAPLQATLSGEASANGTQANLALRLPRQDGAALGIAAALEADLRATLAADQWTPRGTLAVGDLALSIDAGQVRPVDGVLRAEALQITAARHGALRVDGDVPLGADGTWSLRLASEALAWPRDGATPITISGSVAVEGLAGTPTLRPDLLLLAPGAPSARLRGSVRREPSGLRIDDLALDAATARASATGVLSFDAPATLSIQVDDFDPALFDPQWPGAMDAVATFDGALRDDGASGVLDLRALGGVLRGRPVEGSARVQLAAGRWMEGRATLASGSARLAGEVRDAGAWIDVQADIPDLGDLWPGAAGQLAATWRREAGDRLTLRADDLAIDGARARRIDAEARLGSGRDAPLAANLRAGGVAWREQSLGALALDVEGTRSRHVARLTVDAGARDATLALDGGWDDRAWSGRLDRLEARAEGASLRLGAPAELRIGTRGVALREACFDTTGGRLCATAAVEDGAGEATLELDGLSLAALRAWLADPSIPALEGLARGSAQARWAAGALVDARAQLESPRGLARLPKRPDLDLGYADLAIDATWADGAGRVQGGARLVPEGRIDLGADLTPVDGGVGIDATIDLRVSDLSGIEAFTTTIAEPEGELRGQLRLQGGALPRSVSGALALTGFTAQVPGQALRLRDGVMVLAGVPGQLVLRGSVLSGDGTLTIDGRIDRDDPVPALLRIGGERVRVANTPNLSLLASPDLTLALREGRWQLDGRLDIPRARIDASKLETGADRSPDVVVVDDPDPPDPVRPWRARVRVSLGDDVRLSGFGFDGTLQGALDVSQRQGAQALASGEVTLLGRYAAYGQRLDIKRGGLRWANSPLAEPLLDLRAERKVRGETVALEVRGSAASPTSQVVAAPGTSDSEALALLVTGRPLNRAGAEDRERLSDASAALGAVGSQLLTRSLGGRLGLDEIGVSNDTQLDGEAFTLGKYLSPRLYVGYGIGILTRGEVFTVRYLVTDRIELEANAGATQRAAVNWRIER